MTSLSVIQPSRLGYPQRGFLIVGSIGLVAIAVIAAISPRLALHGWLIGFASAGSIPLGAVALLLVHALTGGRWGDVHRPALLGAARATPLLLLLVMPVALGARAIYPWADDASTAGPDVARFYLNAVAVGLRSIIGLGAMTWLAWRLQRSRPGILEAGLGLCTFVLFMNAAAYDWLLSLSPRFTSSAFGTQIIISQILAALAFAILTSRAERNDPSWSDLGGLLLATTLGLSYLILMGLAINWYGDKPDQARWYMIRTLHGWAWLEAAGTVIGAAGPMLALLLSSVRNRPMPLCGVALCSLAGLLIQYIWLVAPDAEPLSAPVGILAALVIATMLIAASQILAPLRQGSFDGA